MSNNLLPVSFMHTDLLNDGDDELIYTYCETVYRKEDYSSPEEMLDQILALEYFPDPTFHALLEKYFKEHNKDIEDEVRGYAQHKAGFLMTHGLGYDWFSADLCGGTANGYAFRDFENWLAEQGFVLIR